MSDKLVHTLLAFTYGAVVITFITQVIMILGPVFAGR